MSTLADPYDPDAMPPDLRQAHSALDRAVDGLYRRARFASEPGARGAALWAVRAVASTTRGGSGGEAEEKAGEEAIKLSELAGVPSSLQFEEFLVGF